MPSPYTLTWGCRGDSQPRREHFSDRFSALRRHDELKKQYDGRLVMATVAQRSGVVVRRLSLAELRWAAPRKPRRRGILA